ncbi:MAG: MerR family transcriptional regulator [Acetobacter fabarum]|jgi:DNA-binding transcriptional MerR regulator|nr:MerR family transcriptional regulator [Acetobacter fabarum]MCI1909142.1 MerR family transcriptional regulator [Acetobacter fabarum]MCI1927987.1 MerR family transcriptional regulator [Acetobacter fabarum]MCI1948004.1 MerR family transcriptional regulator [Acetobacter fabarum]MCI1988995.1 MerR family transcriptional regulator [Acetobacter fabarum]
MTIDGTFPHNDAAHDVSDADMDVAESASFEKGPHAFRTISEVADELHVPQHTLRLWETQFHQVRPLKRGGGRRYYRPEDVLLLARIADLLYNQGYTVKGVQRLLQEGDASQTTAPQSAETVTPDENSVAEAALAEDAQTQNAALVADYQQVEAVVAELPAAVEAGLELALVQVMGQNVRLRSDLADVLVELEAIRRKILV